jgi:hypothetical protein
MGWEGSKSFGVLAGGGASSQGGKFGVPGGKFGVLVSQLDLEACDLFRLGSDQRFERPEACDLLGQGSEAGLQVGDPSQQGLQEGSRRSGGFHASIGSQRRPCRHMPRRVASQTARWAVPVVDARQQEVVRWIE